MCALLQAFPIFSATFEWSKDLSRQVANVNIIIVILIKKHSCHSFHLNELENVSSTVCFAFINIQQLIFVNYVQYLWCFLKCPSIWLLYHYYRLRFIPVYVAECPRSILHFLCPLAHFYFFNVFDIFSTYRQSKCGVYSIIWIKIAHNSIQLMQVSVSLGGIL